MYNRRVLIVLNTVLGYRSNREWTVFDFTTGNILRREVYTEDAVESVSTEEIKVK